MRSAVPQCVQAMPPRNGTRRLDPPAPRHDPDGPSKAGSPARAIGRRDRPHRRHPGRLGLVEHPAGAVRQVGSCTGSSRCCPGLAEGRHCSATPSGGHRHAPNAPITVVEYGDFECPHCRAAEPVTRELLTTYPQVHYVWRHLPLGNVHPHAALAAEAVEAAAAQGAFWPMHALLLQRQDHLDLSDLIAYADELGLDVRRFERGRSARQGAPAHRRAPHGIGGRQRGHRHTHVLHQRQAASWALRRHGTAHRDRRGRAHPRTGEARPPSPLCGCLTARRGHETDSGSRPEHVPRRRDDPPDVIRAGLLRSGLRGRLCPPAFFCSSRLPAGWERAGAAFPHGRRGGAASPGGVRSLSSGSKVPCTRHKYNEAAPADGLRRTDHRI